MPISDAQKKAVRKYKEAHYDRQEVSMPKGKKEKVKAHAEQMGESVNAFINRAVDQQMVRDKELQGDNDEKKDRELQVC